jgi:hypothetical protein
VENLINPVTLASAGLKFQPLFNDFDNATAVKAVISPEFRALSATYSVTVVGKNLAARPSAANNTNAWGLVQVNGRTSLQLILAGLMNAGTSANNKDVALQIIRWYPVYLPRLDSTGQDTPDGYLPVAATYTATLGNNSPSAWSGSDTPRSLDATMFLADTIAAVLTPGAPDENIYSPANDVVAVLSLDVHGASFVTIDVKQGVAAPDKVQVFTAFE